MNGRRTWLVLVLVALTALVSAGLVEAAYATVTVSRAEVSGDRLRVEGRATASRPITVDGVHMGSSSSSGDFRIERSGYTRPVDCTVDVNDGSATPTNVRLSGCTVTTPTPPTNSTSRASWRSQNAFCRAHQTCGFKRRWTTSSACRRCSSRKESRTTEIDSIEPPQRHHFSTTWRRPRVLMKRW